MCAHIVSKGDKTWRGKVYINLSCNINCPITQYYAVLLAHQYGSILT